MNDKKELSTEEMNKEMLDFYKNGTTKQRDDLEYMICLGKEQYGWNILSSGNQVYVEPPKLTGKECGEGLKLMLERLGK